MLTQQNTAKKSTKVPMTKIKLYYLNTKRYDEVEDHCEAVFPVEREIEFKEDSINLIRDTINLLITDILSIEEKQAGFYKEYSDEFKLEKLGWRKLKENEGFVNEKR